MLFGSTCCFPPSVGKNESCSPCGKAASLPPPPIENGVSTGARKARTRSSVVGEQSKWNEVNESPLPVINVCKWIYIYYIYMYMGLSFHKWGYNWLIAGISGLNCEWSIRNTPDGPRSIFGIWLQVINFLGEWTGWHQEQYWEDVFWLTPLVCRVGMLGVCEHTKNLRLVNLGSFLYASKFFVCILQALPQNLSQIDFTIFHHEMEAQTSENDFCAKLDIFSMGGWTHLQQEHTELQGYFI